MDEVFKLSSKITQYKICPELNIDFTQIGHTTVHIENVGNFTVQGNLIIN